MTFFSQARGVARTLDGGTARRATLCAALALVAFVATLARSAQVFAPDSIYVQPFNSDSALPVLMANDPVIDIFRQDQIGAYPFLFCQLVRKVTGFVWTETSIYLLQVCWLFLGALAVHALGRRTRFVAPALFLAVLCLHPTVSHYVFVLNQRYAWQITPLLFAWLAFRRLCARLFDAQYISPTATDAPALASPRARLSLSAFASFVFSFLAVWTSPMSAPMLAVYLALELARARISAADAILSSNELRGGQTARDDPRPARLTLARLLACAAPLASAVVFEQLLKAAYHRHALKHFGTDYRTPTQVDWGHLSENLRAQLANLTQTPAWWLVIPALVAAPFVIFLLLRQLFHARTRQSSNLRSAVALHFALEGARLDASLLMLGSLAVALLNFASAFLFLWIRLNAYGGRYLALTHLCGAFAGLVALFLALTLHPRIYSARRIIFPALALACALVLAIKFPPRVRNPVYDELREVAAGLAEKNPRAVLLGGYWDTYVLAALRPRDALTPVPAEDQLLRTPWTAHTLGDAAEVVVVHHNFPYSGGVEVPGPYMTFGDGHDPPPVLHQYGATLRLETSRWYERDGFVFSLYRNETRAGAH
jgi:hypothetical protein